MIIRLVLPPYTQGQSCNQHRRDNSYDQLHYDMGDARALPIIIDDIAEVTHNDDHQD